MKDEGSPGSVKGGISGGSYSGKSREPSLSHTVDDCSVLDADAGATGVQIEGGSSEKITEKPKRKREASSGMEGEVEKRQMPNRRDAPKSEAVLYLQKIQGRSNPSPFTGYEEDPGEPTGVQAGEEVESERVQPASNLSERAARKRKIKVKHDDKEENEAMNRKMPYRRNSGGRGGVEVVGVALEAGEM